MQLRRSASTSVLALLAAMALAGCGSDSDAAKPRPLLTKEQITAALITVDDIGQDFRVKDDSDDENNQLGCLAAMDSIDDGFPGAKESVDITIEAAPDPNVPEVGNQINVFEDEAAAIAALDTFATSLADCEVIDETKEGVRFALSVENDDATSTADVDDQFNIDVKGTLASEGLQFPISQRGRFIRIGNVITAVYLASLETSTSNDTEHLAELAIAKILPLINGGAVGTPEPLDLTSITG